MLKFLFYNIKAFQCQRHAFDTQKHTSSTPISIAPLPYHQSFSTLKAKLSHWERAGFNAKKD